MPIYEYACGACGHRFERLVRGAEPSTCPACATAALRRLVSAFALAAGADAITRMSAGQAAPAVEPTPCDSCADAGVGASSPIDDA